MTDGERWRRYITGWVIAACLTAIVCCWLLKPARYLHMQSAESGVAAFDNQTGNVVIQKPVMPGK